MNKIWCLLISFGRTYIDSQRAKGYPPGSREYATDLALGSGKCVAHRCMFVTYPILDHAGSRVAQCRCGKGLPIPLAFFHVYRGGHP